MKKYKISELPENIQKTFEGIKGNIKFLAKAIGNKEDYENWQYQIAITYYLFFGDYSVEYEIKHYIDTIKTLELMSPEIENELMPYYFGEDNEYKL